MQAVATVLEIYCNHSLARDTSHHELHYNYILDRGVVVVDDIVDSGRDVHRRTCTCLDCCCYFSAFRVSFRGSCRQTVSRVFHESKHSSCENLLGDFLYGVDATSE